MSSLRADPQHNTEHEGSLRGRCQRRKTAPLAAPLPPALIPELWTGFWHADVSADPPFTSARAVGEGMQKWHDPVTHPTATTHLTAGSTRVRQPETAQAEPHTHCQQPPASPSKLAGSALGDSEGQAGKALRTSCQCHTTPSSSLLQVDLLPPAPRQGSAGCLCPPVPAHTPLSRPFTHGKQQLHRQEKSNKEKQKNTLPNKHVQVRTQHFITQLPSTWHVAIEQAIHSIR